MVRLTLVLAVLLGLPARAQTAQPQTSSAPAASAQTRITAYTLPPDKLKQAEALYKLERKLRIVWPIYSFLVLVAILSWGIAARYREWARKVSRWRFVQAVIFVPLLFLTLGIADLPLRMYGHHISLQYGLSVQNWGSWFGDYGKGEMVNFMIFTPILWLMQTIIRLSPRRWWFYFWLICMPVVVFLFFIGPLIIDPLFNKFEPLENTNPGLVEAIGRVEQRAGVDIPRDHLYEMKASEKVTTLNAYVTGFGATKRIVIWDTTIRHTTMPETLFVVGHEMGHYVLHHVMYGIIGVCAALLVGLYILFRVSGWVLSRFSRRWRMEALHDWAAFPMIFLLAGIMGFFAEPVGNSISRYVEHQADIYGLEVTHGINPDSQQVAAHSFQVLGEISLDYPYPSRLEVFWHWTHPPISDRVRFALDYDPWSKGESPKYVK